MECTGYGDSTQTGDDKYILASFRADANLGWVVDLRSFLNLPELKYKDYLPRRQHVASNRRIQTSLNKGLAEAELTIIDAEKYKTYAIVDLLERGAEPGCDFDSRTVYELATDDMLRDSPFYLKPLAPFSESYGVDTLFTRPRLSHLPRSLPEFDTQELIQRAGGKLRDVQVLTARAHSMLSPTEFLELRIAMGQPMHSGGLRNCMERIKNLAHVFDVEHKKSVPLLNELVGHIAQATGVPEHSVTSLTKKTPISEVNSRSSDHIQAADFAAGWAGDLLVATNNDFRALARQVRWVTLNGLSIPSSN